MKASPLVRAVCDTLEQDIELMRRLTDAQYIERHPQCFDSAIGMHVRHNLDHVLCFLEGVESGLVDYEGRARDAAVETGRETAIERTAAAVDALGRYAEEDTGRSLRVREESDSGELENNWLPSSVGRELQFLLGHTVHHNALIATIAWDAGVALPAGFGVAPSTRRHLSKAAN